MILNPKETYVVEYPEAIKFADTQLGIFWLPDEIKVEKDIQDILTNMTPAEKHGVITTLKLFTMYELIVGGEYWQNLVFEKFQRPADIQRMAKCFSFMELCVHAPFYAKINEALGLANDEFYNSYLNDPVLLDRITMLHDGAQNADLPLALAHLAIAEGVILYSSFAFLKHFQSQGKNKLLNVVRGINFSSRDECVIAGTEVFVENIGWRKIEDIEEGDLILTYQNEKLIFGKVSRTVSVKSNEYYTFESDTFHQTVTPNHRMVTTEGFVLANQATENQEYVCGGFKVGKETELTQEDMLKLSSGDLEWFNKRITDVSAEWAVAAKNYLISSS